MLYGCCCNSFGTDETELVVDVTGSMICTLSKILMKRSWERWRCSLMKLLSVMRAYHLLHVGFARTRASAGVLQKISCIISGGSNDSDHERLEEAMRARFFG